MKWLLITNTQNRNPGDEWIRIGVQRIIRDVDPFPEFVLRNKEFVEDQDAEVKFDKAIWCGSPLFWSHQYQGCWENYWWVKWIHGWLFNDKRKILVMGVGDVIGNEIHDKTVYNEAIATVKSKCWLLVTRNKICSDPEIQIACCPSVFALAGDKTPKTLNLCNLMPDGAHDSLLNEQESKAWHEKVKPFSEFLKNLGFEIVCHAAFEEEFIETLGWPKEKIHRKPTTAEGYFPIYAKAKVFVGNRLHGAMLTIGAGGAAMAIGYDSRLGMVSYVNGTVVRPTELNFPTVKKWINSPHPVYDWQPEYDKQVVIVRRFAEA